MIEYFQNLKKALQSSGHDTAVFMSARLRSDAVNLGWPSEIADGLEVKHSDGGFSVMASPTHKDKIMDLEYGTPTTQPTAVIRKFNNRYHEFDDFLINRSSYHLGSAS